MFHPLADTENSVTFRLPEGARTDVMGAPSKENLNADTKEAPCDSDGKPMDHDSTAHRR